MGTRDKNTSWICKAKKWTEWVNRVVKWRSSSVFGYQELLRLGIQKYVSFIEVNPNQWLTVRGPDMTLTHPPQHDFTVFFWFRMMYRQWNGKAILHKLAYTGCSIHIYRYTIFWTNSQLVKCLISTCFASCFNILVFEQL